MPSRGEARPSKADLARQAVVRRGHPEATTKLGSTMSLVLDHLLTTALRQGLELPPRLDLEPYEGKGGV